MSERDKYEEILNYHALDENYLIEILYAAQDIFEAKAKLIKEKEPYATNTIRQYEVASRAASDLASELE